MENYASVLIPFFAIFVGEIGDNSFLLLAYLATTTERRKTIFAAALVAYLLMNSLSAWAGNALKQWVHLETLQWIVGILFIGIGLIAFIKKEKLENQKISTPKSHSRIFITTLSAILAAEIIDRSNIGTGLFATQYPPSHVIAGVFTAHMITSLIAIEIGKRFLKKLNPQKLTQIAAIIFIGSGVLILAQL